jgi:hypothetical protein
MGPEGKEKQKNIGEYRSAFRGKNSAIRAICDILSALKRKTSACKMKGER